MGSKISDKLLQNMKIAPFSDEDNNEDIKSDNKINKHITSNIKGDNQDKKKMGRPFKKPGTKKEKIGVLLEPKYIEILKKEAAENEMDLSPYVSNQYIVKVLKQKYKSLQK